jgi:AbiV family abortive infection protein
MPSVKIRDYQLPPTLLVQYRDAALKNAAALLEEASLLLAHKHFARAYFLAVAAVEETGKAVQAFDGIGRNLKDSAVSTRLKLHFEDHSQKITSAFLPWLLATPNLRDEAMSFVNTMIDVKHGREPSMYTDIQREGPKVVTPDAAVRSSVAENCVRLAERVLLYAKPHVTESQPKVTTRVQDAFFAMKPGIFQKMANTGDFWAYYISRMEAGDKALEAAVTEYNRLYFSKNAKFNEEAT